MRKTLLTSLVLIMAIVAALFVACNDRGDDKAVDSGNPKANVRVIHASYDAPDVDVRVDGTVAVAGLGYGATSGYAQVDQGSRNVTVTPAGATTPVAIDLDLSVVVNKSYTVVALDQFSAIDAVLQEDLRTPTANKAKVRFIHAATDAPAVDIKLNSGSGTTVFSNRAFKSISDYIEVDAGPYAFAVTATGLTTEEALFKSIGLQNGKVYTIVALGTLNKTDGYPFRVRVFTDNDDGGAYADLLDADLPDANVRVIHAGYDAGPVDILVDDAAAVSSLTYGEAAAYATVTAGARNIKVTAAGTLTPALAEMDDEFRSGNEYTLVAVDQVASLDVLIGGDDREPDPSRAKVRFINAASDSPRLDVRLNSGFGPKQFPNIGFKGFSAYSAVDPGQYQYVLTMADSTWEIVAYVPATLEAGQVYTIVALGTLDEGDGYDFTLRMFSDNDDGDTYTDLVVEPRTKSDVRVIHLSYNAPAVSVLIDGYTALSNLSFKGASKYTELNAGTRNIQVRPSSGGSSVINADLDFTAGSEYTIFAVNQLTAISALFEEDARASVADMAKIRFVHAVHDAPAIDVKLETGHGAAVFAGQSFQSVSGYQVIDDSTYRFVVTLAGDTNEVLVFNPIALAPNTTYTLVAHGTYSLTDTVQFGLRLYTDNNDGNSFVDLAISKSPVRLIHASYDAPTLDVLSDGVRRSQAVPYQGTAGYVDFNAGTRNITVVRANQTSPVLLDDTLLLDEDVYYTQFAFGPQASIQGDIIVDDRTLSATDARVRFVNAVPDGGSLDFKIGSGSGSVLFGNTSYTDVSAYQPLAVGSYVFALTSSGSTEEIKVYDPYAMQANNLYTIVVFGTLDTLDAYPLATRVFKDNGTGNVVNTLTINEPSIRVIHASYDAPSIQVQVDDTMRFDTIAYAGTKGYSEVNPGVRNIKVLDVGLVSTYVDLDLDLAFNTDYTIFAVDEVAMIDAIYSVDDRTPDPASPRVRFVQASPDAPTFDVKLSTDSTSATVFNGVDFKDITSYQPVNIGAQRVVLTPAGSGTELKVYLPFTFVVNTVYTIMTYGTYDPGDAYPFRVKIFTDNGGGTSATELTIAAAKVRVIHASVDGYPIETLFGDTIKHTNVVYQSAGGYVDIGPGDRNVKVRQSGFTTTPVVDTTLAIGFRTDYTMLLLDSLSSMSAVLLQDNRTTLSTSAKFRFVHTALDMPAVDIRRDNPTGTVLAGNVAFGQASSYITTTNGAYVISIVETGTSNEIARYESVTLNNSSAYSMTTFGTLNNADSSPLTSRMFIDNGSGNQSLAMTPKSGFVRFIHLSPDAVAMDFTVDGATQATNVGYLGTSAYVNADPGTRALQLLETGTANVVIDTSVVSAPDGSYTVFGFDGPGAEVSPVITTDNRGTVTNPKIRFAHGVPDAPNYRVVYLAFGVVQIPIGGLDNVAFGTVTSYSSTVTPDAAFVFQVVDPNNQTNVFFQFEPVSITGSTVYTFSLSGTLDTGDAYPIQGRLYIDNGTGGQYIDLVVDAGKDGSAAGN